MFAINQSDSVPSSSGGGINHNSTDVGDDSHKILILKQVMYVSLGLFITISNAIIAVAILRQRKLRRQKEILILLGLVIADLINGLALLIGGSRRLALIGQRYQHTLVTCWYCLTTGTPSLFTMGDIAPAIMFATISFDRFFALATNRYQSLGLCYIQIVLLLDLCGLLSIVATGFIAGMTASSDEGATSLSYPQRHHGTDPWLISILCISEHVYPGWYPKLIHGISMGLSWTGVAMYGCITVLVFRLSKRTGHHQIDRIKLKRQIRVTKTVLTIVVWTICLHTLPFTFYWAMFLRQGNQAGYIYGQVIGILAALNSGKNIFIFIAKQKDLRQAIIKSTSRLKSGSQRNTLDLMSDTTN